MESATLHLPTSTSALMPDTRTCAGCGESLAGRRRGTIYCTQGCYYRWVKRVRRVQQQAQDAADKLGHLSLCNHGLPVDVTERQRESCKCYRCKREITLEYLAGAPIARRVHGDLLTAMCGRDHIDF